MASPLTGDEWETDDGVLDSLNCRFGLEGRKKEVCNSVYSWLWGLDGGKYDPQAPLEKGNRKNDFYNFKRKIDGSYAERRAREEKVRKQKEEQRRKAGEGQGKGGLTPDPKEAPKPKEKPKKKRTKPGTFGYYGWYVEWAR
ncbi:hypothetical protein MHSWG343_00900 [Candidatus Mycoplasma haematohominis]|uniref:Uncharacterized protein n=1 Tax=Candidatus Mycoplasma haematohominis TaxID=1494318 RepID=A0A478FPG2_9MOLU|nr:hypothetical protein MHSWG343_00900 [Candidatus Mycoplasma haemohominis]